MCIIKGLLPTLNKLNYKQLLEFNLPLFLEVKRRDLYDASDDFKK